MAANKSHEASSSSSSSSRGRWRYDVFLSFRGEDTRRNFTDHLYIALQDAGINVFRDDNELQVGENISAELLEAIQDSRISIIVLSRDYAASSWCLEELVKIMECRKTVQQVALPVFYKVDPLDVRKHKHSFEEAFGRHEERFTAEKEMVLRWRNALTEAANLKGFHYTPDSLEGEFVKKIVKEIRKHASIGYLDVAQYPVGLDSHVQKLDYELRVQSNDVRIIGICAMGGMGKTTIAKEFYNHLLHGFEYKGFLDVRESSKNGYLHLQNKLLSEILKSNTVVSIPEGITEIRHRLKCTRVLLVLDNVDCSEQLSDLAIMREHGWLASGSKIIITTRDEHLLTEIKVDYRHMVNKLNDDKSLELFSWHAFSRSHPEEGFVGLSKDVIHYCKGMPLALTVLGSSLSGRMISFWEGTLKKLKSIPDPTIQKTLKISFDALDRTEQDIFLDVACFFIGGDKGYAHAILDGCGFSPETGITTLISRCLLTINKYNKLMMHDLLRDMGREIVCEECPKELGKRSRLWSHDDVLDVLKKHKGTEAVEGLILELSTQNEEHLSTKAFANMRNLRLLQLNYVHLTGNYDHFSKELRWVCWHGFPSKFIPKNFHLQDLVVLDMRYSKLRQFSKEIKVLKKLKVLDLSHSTYLTKTPNFSKTPNLEELKLQACRSLVDLHPSIGNLDRLVLLDMRDCKQLKSLPNSIGTLKALKILNLSGCTGSTRRSFDSVIWSWVSPRKSLNSVNLMLSSLLGLTSLVSLDLGYCNLSDEVIPKDFGSLYSLEELNLGGNNFCCLQARISTLPKLKWLSVNFCKSLLSLPELPASLTVLHAYECNNFVNLPANFSNLPELRELRVGDCTSLQSLPDLPRKFEYLGASNCTSLERFPNVSRLQGDAYLDLVCCPILDVNPGWADSNNYLVIETSRSNLVASAVTDAIPQNPRFVIVDGIEIPSQFRRHQSISPSLCLPVKDYFEDAVLDVCILFDHFDYNYEILYEYDGMYGKLWLRRYGSLVLRSGDQLELLIRPASQKIKFKKWGVHLYDKHKGGIIQSNNVNQSLHDAEILYDDAAGFGSELKIGYGSNDYFLHTQRHDLDEDFPFDIDINIKPT